MLGQRLRRWPNIEPTSDKCTMFERKSSCPANARHLYDIYARRPNVFDVGPTLHKVIQMFCTFSQTLYIYLMLVQCWASVADVGLTLKQH